MSTIQVSCLGHLGRFGNQLHQYAFAKGYAQHHNAILETPRWIGCELFGVRNSPISGALPKNQDLDKIQWGKSNIDVFGHFQFQRAIEYYSRTKAKEWFKFTTEITSRFQPPRHKIVAHLRRTDYLKYPTVFCTVSRQSYINAAKQLGYNEDDIVWLSDEHPTMPDDPLGYINDFMTMMRAEILLRSNSTFSWWASVLGTARTYSPLVLDRVGEQTVEFVEGNWPKIADPRNNPNYPAILTDLHLPN